MNITEGTHDERCRQLSRMIGPLDDNENNHYIWVDRNGGVHVGERGENVPPDALFYGETLIAGNGYVGAKASKDKQYIDREVTFLEDWWKYCNANQSEEPQFADYPVPRR